MIFRNRRHTRTKHKEKKSNSKKKKTNTIRQQKQPQPCVNIRPISDEHAYAAFDKKHFAKQLLSKFAPDNIVPENDFYDYINTHWLKNLKIEDQHKYMVQIDSFRLLQHDVYMKLDNIIVDYCKKNRSSELSRQLHNFYTSITHGNSLSYSKQLAANAVSDVETLLSENNPWKLLAFFNKDEMIRHYLPLHWSMDLDEKNMPYYKSHINQHAFMLNDIDVYVGDEKNKHYNSTYKQHFFKYAKQVFDVTLGKSNHAFNPVDIFDVELEIFDAGGCMIEKNEVSDTYHDLKGDDALTEYGFDWHEFSRQLGFARPPKRFVVFSTNYLACMTRLFVEKWNTPKWKTYWTFLLLERLVRITKKWEHIMFEFKGKFEKGQDQMIYSDAVSASLYMSIPFNTFLTNEYIKKYENPQAIKYTKVLCFELKRVFRAILSRNSWMSRSTKQYAIRKLDAFKFVFGKPEKLERDPLLNYSTVLYDNLQKIGNWRHRRFLRLDAQKEVDMPMMDWSQYPAKMSGSQAYIVNASYTPSKNSIYINLGYIQQPFIDLHERGIEYNLSQIGYTLAHEMGHGFDDFGSKYGIDGNMYDWWTKEDKQKYKSLQRDVINQYELFAKRDGITFDASLSIGENLADIAGLAICEEYLHNFQQANKDIIPIGALSFEAFYTYFAFHQRQFVSKNAMRSQLKTNPHPLDKYRCNVPLSRSAIFRGLYNVQSSDDMWWHNTNTIW